ncbi:excinuclease ABC subunit UvrA [Antrihabitans sp. YC2-6]|uniref:excinuclease ABC subunit UvrA n=1 Tax=Antrihabitans sp. YC2-6 TaxID=2799498 RepID=UPI0018F6A9DD|nr:excinuclease ABC subunit UvrA [Antrihabitans sp. YC2-6]MBJ8348385.1 excinuclease ABC subunit UvrA [Antrihabitans sp. YC2-6]
MVSDPPWSIVKVRGAREHNLKDISVDIPLHRLIAVTGVSGSGKSSLAMGVLYGEGSRRYLEGLSAYTRRRLDQSERPAVDAVENLPPALALRQRPPVPGPRSTVGTASELLNGLRLLFSRIGVRHCVNGHGVEPAYFDLPDVPKPCPVCAEPVANPSAIDFSFNSPQGACPACGGLGVRDEVDPSSVVPDEALSIDDGAVVTWRIAGRPFLASAAKELGVRTDVPFRDLSDNERRIVLSGPSTHVPITVVSKAGNPFAMNAAYDNAVVALELLAAKTTSEATRTRISRFMHRSTCTVCHGSKLNPTALAVTVCGRNIAEASEFTIASIEEFLREVGGHSQGAVSDIVATLSADILRLRAPLVELGVGYLPLSRSAATLSTGERQRLQLAAATVNDSTGVLYVLDEPSSGMHAENVSALVTMLRRMVARGHSVIVVDHNLDLVRQCDVVIELGPGAGDYGGSVISVGSPGEVTGSTADFLSGRRKVTGIDGYAPRSVGRVAVRDVRLHNVSGADLELSLGAITCVTGVSGAGKSVLLLQSVVPALVARLAGDSPPRHVGSVEIEGELRRVKVIDATPIGRNSRSTPATYNGVFDKIRALFALSNSAKRNGWGATRFSYNTPEGRCPECDGLGELVIDLQYLPDLRTVCPTCRGMRYNAETLTATVHDLTIADVLALSVDRAVEVFAQEELIRRDLENLKRVGLGYLHLGEPAPQLSGGEAQRLRLATELPAKGSGATLYVLDEPTTGLHLSDVDVLLSVLQQLVLDGGTVVAITHEQQLIAAADHEIRLGPGGGPEGGRVVYTR